MRNSILLLLGLATMLSALGPMPNLRVPSDLEKTEFVFMIQHRFYGKVTEDPFNTFFGLDLGANVGIGIRYAILPRFEINGAHNRYQNEYLVGASYAVAIPQIFLAAQADIQYFDYQLPTMDERRRNFYYGFALQSMPILEKISPTLNIGYDGYNERLGLGFGLDAEFDLSVGPLQKAGIIGEYFPVIDQDTTVTEANSYFSVGFKLKTYGHYFVLLVGNGSELSTRRVMLGTSSNDLHFGFYIQRLLDL